MTMPSKLRFFIYAFIVGIISMFIKNDITLVSIGKITLFSLYLTAIYFLVSTGLKKK